MSQQQQIILDAAQLKELEKLALSSLPNESCAFLLGAADGEGGSKVVVKEVLPMANADRSQVSFTISPEDTLRAYQLAEGRGLHVVGIFHSHPSVPSPSGTDARFMEVNPVVWVIYSTTEERFGAWIYGDDDGDGGGRRVKRVEIITSPTSAARE